MLSIFLVLRLKDWALSDARAYAADKGVVIGQEGCCDGVEAYKITSISKKGPFLMQSLSPYFILSNKKV